MEVSTALRHGTNLSLSIETARASEPEASMRGEHEC